MVVFQSQALQSGKLRHHLATESCQIVGLKSPEIIVIICYQLPDYLPLDLVTVTYNETSCGSSVKAVSSTH